MHARTPSVGTLGGLQTGPPVVAGPHRERRKPKPVMNGLKKSDGAIRPVREANKGAHAPAEPPEERASTKGNPGSQSTHRTQCRASVTQAADRIRQAVERNPKERLTALFHHITPEALGAAYLALRKDAAAGVDGVTWAAYGEGLEERLLDLHRRLHHGGAYRAPPVRRVEIPKPDGGTRPLGIAALEDKIVQKAVVEVILTPIFEVEFLGFSYGFRPGRGAHDALDALAFGIGRRKVNWIVDADVRAYFDTIPRDWLMTFVEYRIGDRRVTRLIRKWLSAGVMDDGAWTDTGMGTPQGNIVTPRTQKVTFVIGAAVAGFRRVRTAARRARDRDGMADGDLVFGDQNLLHEEADDTLAFREVQGFGGRAQPRQKAGQGLGEAEIGLPILDTIDGRLQFAVQRLFLPAELGRSVAQFVDGDQLFLIGRDQPVDALADPDQAMPKVGLALLVEIGAAGRLQSPVDLCFHQCGIFEQADQFGPHDVVEQILAHWAAVAQRGR